MNTFQFKKALRDLDGKEVRVRFKWRHREKVQPTVTGCLESDVFGECGTIKLCGDSFGNAEFYARDIESIEEVKAE